mmetsp:Transcript_2290/g.8506  ORF Transcript_2290/g.8506 Transcript_2290/m.8506 type:complete len:110 (+) Transcript_2290:721-1050(+)
MLVDSAFRSSKEWSCLYGVELVFVADNEGEVMLWQGERQIHLSKTLANNHSLRVFLSSPPPPPRHKLSPDQKRFMIKGKIHMFCRSSMAFASQSSVSHPQNMMQRQKAI